MIFCCHFDNNFTSRCALRHNGVHFFKISTSTKVLRTCGVLRILTSKCALRHNGVHFFDMSTSKTAPSMVCFVGFDLEMWLAPQGCTIVHLSSPYIESSVPAALASLLFDPPEPQNIGKAQFFATFLPFRAPASSFFRLFLFSDLLSSAFLFSDSSHLCL